MLHEGRRWVVDVAHCLGVSVDFERRGPRTLCHQRGKPALCSLRRGDGISTRYVEARRGGHRAGSPAGRRPSCNIRASSRPRHRYTDRPCQRPDRLRGQRTEFRGRDVPHRRSSPCTAIALLGLPPREGAGMDDRDELPDGEPGRPMPSPGPMPSFPSMTVVPTIAQHPLCRSAPSAPRTCLAPSSLVTHPACGDYLVTRFWTRRGFTVNPAR